MPLDLFATDTEKQARQPLDLFRPLDLFSDESEESPRLRTAKPLEPTQVDVAMDSLVNRPGNVIDLFGKNQKDLQPVSQDQTSEGPAGPQLEAPFTKEAVFGDMPQAVSDQATNELQAAHGQPPTAKEALSKAAWATHGLLEAGVTLATVPFGLTAGGVAIVGGMLTPGESMEDVYKTAEKAMSAFIAIPRTKEGKEIIAATMYPLEWMKEKGNKLGDNVVKNGLDIVDPETGNTVNVFKDNVLAGTIIGSVPELLAYIIPLLGRFRNKALPADAVALSEVVSEAANLRNIARTKGPQSPEYQAAFAEAVKKRMPTDPVTTEATAKPMQEAPAPRGEVIPTAPVEAPAPTPNAPVVVNARHWSTSKIEGPLDFKRLGQITAGNNQQAVESAKLGVWFTDQETPISEKQTVPNEAKLTLKNPLVLTNDSVPAVDVMGDKIQDAKQWLMDEVERAGGGEKLREELQSKGYDGIILEDSEFDNAKSYVAFGKDQIELKPAETQLVKEPWKMTRDEFRYAENKPKVDAIQQAILQGKRIVNTTQYKATQLTKPEHISIDKNGDVRIAAGNKRLALTDDYVDAMANQAGFKLPIRSEKVFHHAEVEQALTEGKPVPSEVLKDYPDLDKAKSAAPLDLFPEETKADPKPSIKQPKAAPESKITTLRGAIKKMGGLNVGNFKGEFKDLGIGVNKLRSKNGEHLDIAEQRLKADGWLREDENLIDVLRSPENLRRNKIAGEGIAKREQDKTPQEKQFEKEMAFEPEAPPEGDYVQLNAEDLPEGKKLTIIDDSAHGWDVYEVTEKDEFGITLKDGQTIQLSPGQKVQVRQEDIVTQPIERPSLVLKGEKQMPKPQAEMRTRGKGQKGAEQGGLEFAAPETPDTLTLKGERVSAKEALQAQKQGIRAAAERPPSGQASTGQFATRAAPEEPPGGQSFRDTDMPLVDMPELVEITELLGKGKMPQITERLCKALGKFYPVGQGKIKLLARMFKDIKQATATLAHEIGHWVDYLPEKTMARGNILGRIASLKGYMKATMPKAPGALGEITPEDRKRIKKEAKNLLSKPREIDEEITRIFDVTPDDILSIWNAATAGLKSNVDLYRYVAGLNTAEKKSIVKEALKGLVPNELKRFKTIVTEKTGKKITVEAPASDAELRAKYEEMIQAEIKKRELLSREEIMLELKELSRTWKPFDPQVSRAFTKYRYSGAELYADAFSAMMVRPSLVKQLAPKFYDAWFAYLENKPEIKSIYDEIIDRYRSGDTQRHRVERLRKSFRENDQLYLQEVDSEFTLKDKLAREIIDVNHAILKYILKIGERNIPAHLNPRYKLEDMAYSGSESEWYMTQIYRESVLPLDKAGLDWVDLGELMFHKRITAPVEEFGGRSQIANPLGWYKDISNARLREQLASMTPEQRDAIGRASEGARKAHEFIIQKWADSHTYPKDLIDKMMDAKNYATWDVAHWLDERYGKGTGARLHHQIGTLSSITNPATATIMKDLSIIKSVNVMAAKRSVVAFMREYRAQLGLEPNMVRRSDRGRGGRAIEPRTSDLGMIQYLNEGKLESWYVPFHIAEMFDANPIQSWAVSQVFRAMANPFRALFVNYNPGFMLVNARRDFMRAMNNLPGAYTGNFAATWWKSLAPAYRSIFAIPDSVVEEMLKGKMLISVADRHGFNPEDVQIEKLLKMYNLKPIKWENNITRPIWNFFNYLDNIGKVIERTTKVASYEYLKKKFPDMPNEVIAHIVRNSGSPDFLRAGRASPLFNNLLLYSNVFKEGIRSDAEAIHGYLGSSKETLEMKKQKEQWRYRGESEWIFKKAYRLILPKMLMFSAILGVMGRDQQTAMNGVSEYDMTNYLIIPLGITPEGKSVYFRYPLDETSRFVGGVFWKLLNVNKHKAISDLFDYTAGQAPAVAPLLGAAVDTTLYASGINPLNMFSGNRAVPEDVFKAGGLRSHKAFAEYMSGKLGGNIVYKFQHDDVDRIKGELEKILGYPIVSNTIGRFIKVSDYGVKEKLKSETDKIEQRRASENLDLKDSVNKILRGEKLDEKDAQVIYTLAAREAMDKMLEGKPMPKEGYLLVEKQADRNLIVGLGIKFGSAFMNAYMGAQNAEEKASILMKYNEMQGVK
jgi:hypothetical protein